MLEARYHLNDPFLTQYWYWLRGACTATSGCRSLLRENVSTLIASRVWTTAGLVLYASLIIVVLGIGMGSGRGLRPGAARHQRPGDHRGVRGHPRVRRLDRADPGVRGEARAGSRRWATAPSLLTNIQHFTLPAIALGGVLARHRRAGDPGDGPRGERT